MRHHHHFHHHHHRGTTVTIGGNAGAIVNIAVMFFVGLLLLGMGVVFVVIAQSTPILYDSFLLTGGILAPAGLLMFGIGIFMWVRRANAQRLKASGVPGQAQIVGMNQTSLYVNGQPVMELQLQVTTAMHAPYVVSRRETVPSSMMGRLASGQPLPVMVDPARPENFVIVWE
jgi:hypothetical protein